MSAARSTSSRWSTKNAMWCSRPRVRVRSRVYVTSYDFWFGREPDARLGAVVEHDLLGQPQAEVAASRKTRFSAGIDGEEVDVVEVADAGAAPGVALRLVLQRRPQLRRRLVALGLVEELEAVAVRDRGSCTRGRGRGRRRASRPRRRPPRAPRPGARAPRGCTCGTRCARPPTARRRSASATSARSRRSRAGTPSRRARRRPPCRAARGSSARLSSGFGVSSSTCERCARSRTGSVTRGTRAGRRGGARPGGSRAP